MGGGSMTWTEMFFSNYADHTALASFTADASLLAGTNRQPPIRRGFFDKQGKALLLEAEGVVGSSGTPTYTFTWRLGETVGSTFLSGTAVGVSAAITMQSGVSNQYWYARLLLTCVTPGQGSTNTTLNCCGAISSGGGFAAPYEYALLPTTPPTATWTATINNEVEQFPNLSVACSASHACAFAS